MKYEMILKPYENAKKYARDGDSYGSLSASRRALEMLIKQMCVNSGVVSDTREMDLMEMIDSLYESDVISIREKDMMHRIRTNANKGSHVDLDAVEIPIALANEVIDELGKLIEIITNSDRSERMSQARYENNIPMEHPDYYSQNHRYYGRWSDCTKNEQLLVIPEYCELKRKAENGDVEAMLDIAIGFLSKDPKNLVWNDNGLVNMPAYFFKGKKYSPAYSYDARYYYWVSEAVITAARKWERGEYVPLRYIATAIWDAYNYAFYRGISNYVYYYVSGINEYYDSNSRQKIPTPIYENQYEGFS